jgi:virulence-associated protein VagC
METKTFKSGYGLAVRLPESFALAPDQTLVIEQNGDSLTIRRKPDAEEGQRSFQRLREALAALGKPSDGIQKRPGFIAPIRRGI